MNKPLLIIIAVFASISLLVWIGTKLNPKPFAPYPYDSQDSGSFPLPGDLPEPVGRFYRTLYGDEIPEINSFILTGRGNLRFQGVTLPARLRFTHDAGKGYRHYIETTLWGVPVMKVNEHFLNLKSRLALPFGVVENEPQVDEAANLGMWSETLMFPGVFISTEGVRWEPIDEAKAKLIVPFGEKEDEFTVYFNPQTGLIDKMAAMRWKNAGDSEKTLWEAQALAWGEIDGWKMPVLFAAQWMDESTPWLVARIEGVTWNADMSEYIQQEGP